MFWLIRSHVSYFRFDEFNGCCWKENHCLINGWIIVLSFEPSPTKLRLCDNSFELIRIAWIKFVDDSSEHSRPDGHLWIFRMKSFTLDSFCEIEMENVSSISHQMDEWQKLTIMTISLTLITNQLYFRKLIFLVVHLENCWRCSTVWEWLGVGFATSNGRKVQRNHWKIFGRRRNFPQTKFMENHPSVARFSSSTGLK